MSTSTREPDPAGTDPGDASPDTPPEPGIGTDASGAWPPEGEGATLSVAADPDETVAQGLSGLRLARRRDAEVFRAEGYRCLERLGRGTYGEVWRAEDEANGTEVAIKFVLRGGHLRWEGFRAEVGRLAQLRGDPGIVHLLDEAPDADPPFYVMVLAHGGSLAARLGGRPLPARDAVAIFRQVADALATVHVKGIRHCDLKPGNVVFDARGRALIADFGQAQLISDVSPALGTFFYMAPDQADLSDRTADARWDVYALGALLYTMLVGRPPHQTDDLDRELTTATGPLPERLRLYRERVLASPRPTAHRKVPGVDARLADLIDACLEVDPDRRLRDAGAVVAALVRRDRALRDRPLMILGLAVPVALLSAVLAGSGWLLRSAIDRSADSLVGQQLESNLACARLASNVFGEILADTLAGIEAEARGEALRAEAASGDWAALERRLVRLFEERARGRGFDAWQFADREGYVRALASDTRPDPDSAIWRTRFTFREWFNGRAEYPEPAPEGTGPTEAGHVSQMFVGRRTNRPVIAFTAPVRADDGSILGVLAAQVFVSELDRWLEDIRLHSGKALVVDRSGHWVEVGEARDAERDARGQLATHARYAALFAEAEGPDRPPGARRVATFDRFDDPGTGRDAVVAGFAETPSTDWGGILVHHDLEEVVAPVDRLRAQSKRVFLAITASVAALVGCSAAWLVRSARRDP